MSTTHVIHLEPRRPRVLRPAVKDALAPAKCQVCQKVPPKFRLEFPGSNQVTMVCLCRGCLTVLVVQANQRGVL